MENSVKLGLIGHNVPYSFSKKYFEQKFQKLLLPHFSYEVFDMETLEAFPQVLKDPEIKGLNVTIPFKEKIIPMVDELSEEAKEIGAINCILVKDGKTKGYNTDAFGFEKTLFLHRKENHDAAIVIGNGGAAKAVKYILNKYSIPFITLSRTTETNYGNITPEQIKSHPLIIQCTPVGTFPNVEDCVPMPFEGITPDHLIIDLVYNPEYSVFIKNASAKGAKTVNGLYMLEQQAEKAWEIWTQKS